MATKPLRRAFVGLVTLALAAGGIVRAEAQSARTEIRLALLPPSALTWLHAIAEERGFYERRGVIVRELRASDSPALLQAVATGSVEAGTSLGDLVIRAVDKGAGIVIAGALLDRTILRLYGGKEVASLKDAAGKPATAGAVRGGTANLLKFQLARAGVDASTVPMVSIANSRDRIVALASGRVASALLLAPFDTLAERDGARVLDVYRDPYVQTPLILNKDWAERNRDAARGLVGAMKDAAAFVNDPANKQVSIEILARFTRTDADVCAESYRFIVEDQRAIPADFSVPEAGLRSILAIDAAVDPEAPRSAAFDLARYYDPSFLR